jgi:hypothetical protein
VLGSPRHVGEDAAGRNVGNRPNKLNFGKIVRRDGQAGALPIRGEQILTARPDLGSPELTILDTLRD